MNTIELYGPDCGKRGDIDAAAPHVIERTGTYCIVQLPVVKSY